MSDRSGHVSPASSRSGAPGSVLREIPELWTFVRAEGFAAELRRLQRPRPLLGWSVAALDWLLVAAAVAAVCRFGWLAVLPALLVTGNRQRALGNLLHDASHRSLDGNRRRARILSRWVLCWPLWVSMRRYRNEHNRHHRHLGDAARDPDFIHDEQALHRGWWSVWASQVFSARMFRVSLLSHLGRMSAADSLGVAVWWSLVTAVLAWLAGPGAAGVFLGLWVTARAFVFHPITSFREISDHVGLVPGSLVGFTRNHPFGGWLGQLFHPHHNGYHLLHHLNPAIPFHALPRAHDLLLRWPRYADAEQCDGYFSGRRSVVASWVSRFRGKAAAM